MVPKTGPHPWQCLVPWFGGFGGHQFPCLFIYLHGQILGIGMQIYMNIYYLHQYPQNPYIYSIPRICLSTVSLEFVCLFTLSIYMYYDLIMATRNTCAQEIQKPFFSQFAVVCARCRCCLFLYPSNAISIVITLVSLVMRFISQ